MCVLIDAAATDVGAPRTNATSVLVLDLDPLAQPMQRVLQRTTMAASAPYDVCRTDDIWTSPLVAGSHTKQNAEDVHAPSTSASAKGRIRMADGNGSSRSLRVAILSTCALSTPPKAYGGTELVVAELARELRNLGHRPTVFATSDSTCVGARSCLFAEPVWPPDSLAELRHATAAWSEIVARSDFDIVHVNVAEALPFTHFAPIPTVATVHHDRVAAFARHYAAYPEVSFVAISKRQAELTWEVAFQAVIHHGLDIERYT